jgi:hypothetical protein
MTRRLCLVCENGLTSDPRSRTRSAACRQTLCRLGGPAPAAEVFEGWADSWMHISVSHSKGTAAKLRERATRCREYVAEGR